MEHVDISSVLTRIVRDHQLAVDKLTEEQFVEALRQALPDFERNIAVTPRPDPGCAGGRAYLATSQGVTYIPGREAAEWKRRYEELLAVIREAYPELVNNPRPAYARRILERVYNPNRV